MRLLLILFVCLLLSCDAEKATVDSTKPWTYWWWMGSAVDSANIIRHLDDFQHAGLGGAHIIPIYGVEGYEAQFKSFLSEDWMCLVHFTIKEAEKRGLGIDVTMGTGWPFGGPWIHGEHAAKRLRRYKRSLASSLDLQGWIRDVLEDPQVKFVGGVAQRDSSRINLLVDESNLLTTTLPEGGKWEVWLATLEPTGQKVKRAAPGGEGFVLDYFDRGGFDQYAAYFDSVFSASEWSLAPRAFYHDSYETYRANWTEAFPERFEAIHGYDIVPLLPMLDDAASEGRSALMHDLRATLSELLYRDFATPWTQWSTDKGRLSRYQAHGSPGNLLDLYALSDIPETESFGCSALGIPGLSCDEDFQPERFGRPNPLTMKFASSPAHLYGKPLVSSETATWLGNHFKVSLRGIKPQVDELFVAGINHIFFHGTTYSPLEENYPGWLFYASTNFGPSSHFYDELPLLNSYIQRCQKPLQESQADTDILLYFPISDLWTQTEGEHLLLLDVHHAEEWFESTPFGETAALLQRQGYQFDYISDRQLSELRVTSSDKLTAGAGAYEVVILPKMGVIPQGTLSRLIELEKQGANLLFVDQVPKRYAGWRDTDKTFSGG
ncbi:MAG: glycosyl hydrolase, partial [Bacteroidota bacterium]